MDEGGARPRVPRDGNRNRGHGRGDRRQNRRHGDDAGDGRGNAHGRGGGRGGGRGRSRAHLPWRMRLGYKKLIELKDKDQTEILLTLTKPDSGFTEALSDIEIHENKEFMKMFLQCIAKACENTSARRSVIELITVFESSLFVRSTLTNYLMGIMMEQSLHHQREYREPITDIIRIVTKMATLMPTSITSVFGILEIMKQVIDNLEKSPGVVDKELSDMFDDCYSLKGNMMKRMTSTKNKKSQVQHNDEEDPPDNFREIPVFPKQSDMDIDKTVFLRRNKTHGGYENLEHYLDVQFRLLREDFVGPLRDGINEYIAAVEEKRENKRVQEVRVYHNVQILSPICKNGDLCHRIAFDVSRLKYVKWDHSKRLIFGSFLCLSPDNFKSLLFATVAERDPKHLKEGVIDIKLEGRDNLRFQFDLDKRYTMAETVAYFEAYRHNLKGLQNIRDNDLPFEKYIVKCNNDVQKPLYLRQNPNATLDLRPLVDESLVLRGLKPKLGELIVIKPDYKFSEKSKPAKEVHPEVATDWPSGELLHVDGSQYRAIKRALTSEFALTQGPPGTGKTYIGLKIVKALLHNYKLWNTNHENGMIDHRPMLIICYTNHALDQFLEGIMDFFRGDVLRVGGRSSSDRVKQCSLSIMRRRQRELRQVPEAIHRARLNAFFEMKDKQEEINRISSVLEMSKRELLHEDMLKPFMGQFNASFEIFDYNHFENSNRNVSYMCDWLGIGAIEVQGEDDANQQDQERAPEQAQANNGNAQGPAGEDENEEELVDIVDEIDALLAQRDLDDLEDEFDEPETELDKVNRMIFTMTLRPKLALNLTELGNKDGWQISKKQKKQLKWNIRKRLSSSDRFTKQEVRQVVDIWNLSINDRWRLYRYWVHVFCEQLRGKILEKIAMYHELSETYKEILMQEDKEIMKNATVLGMTTTGAAKYQSVLQEIQPRVVVVEEAAEVLEAHVITALSRGCEHLILIGDHKQLKPNPTVYKLAREFNLDLSLFERMIKNEMVWDCLELQHRMRPEISEMMTLIYPDLKDHDVVKTYDDVKGISSNLYFIDHDFPEENDEDNKSHSNYHEAEYITALCRYLLRQGYKPDQITILTLYSGQLFVLRKMMPKDTFNGVRITVVDNFQGEENDIILMSLVRSNEDGKVGFLSIENRVCVALSRAKIGLYVIGNIEMIYQKGGKLWRKIISHARRNEKLGTGLKLYCQNHPRDDGIVAKVAKDFHKAPEGGCMKPCDFRLNCGHTCASVCHVLDAKHEEYECRRPCPRVLCENGHRCKRLCFQKCGDCRVLVEKRIPGCGHYDKVPCAQDPATFSCTKKCRQLLWCNHECKEPCGKPHTEYCTEHVEKKWKCGHSGLVLCCKQDEAICNQRCEEVLHCEHICQGTCGSCSGGKLHVGCTSECNRPLICGHLCMDRCSFCPPCRRDCQNRCSHSRCQKKCGQLCVQCNEPCEWRCRHFACGKLCHEPCDRERCNHPCMKRLKKCKHACIGLCGEPCPKLCRICDEDTVTEIFFGSEDEPDARFVELEDCGHIFEVTGLDYFMDQASEEGGEIQLKLCPKCKTPIRRNLRYGNLIKGTLQKIEQVKMRMLGNKDTIKHLTRLIPKLIEDKLTPPDSRKMNYLYDLHRDCASESSLVAIQNQIEFLSKIKKQKRLLEEEFKSTNAFKSEVDTVLEELESTREWVLKQRNYFTDQEKVDIQDEFQRFVMVRKFFLYKLRIKNLEIKVSADLKSKMEMSDSMLMDGKKFTESRQKKVKRTLDLLKDVVPMTGLGISDEERIEIVAAMNLEKGHWFKCPNGHVYAIADCGGATMEAKCPECNATIGGSSHTLRRDNAFAPEMDGATQPAWPPVLQHYDL